MIIIGDKKVIKAMKKTDIIEVAKDYSHNVKFIVGDTRYKNPYIFYNETEDDDLSDLLYNISDYEEIEKIIYEGYTDEDLEDYDGHWYDELCTYKITNDVEQRIMIDKNMINKYIKILENEVDKQW